MKRFIITTLAIVIAFFGTYWLKCQLGINLSKQYSLADYLPVEFMQSHHERVVEAKTGDLLNDSFDSIMSRTFWTSVWMKDKGTVSLSYQSQGTDGSKCLFIDNKGINGWTYAHNKVYAVHPGDRFSFKGDLRNLGGDPTTGFAVTLFDQDKQVLDWSFAKQMIGPTANWVTIAKDFTVPANAAFIQLRIVGSKEGLSFVDNVVFRKK